MKDRKKSYIALGANLGNPEQTLHQAIHVMSQTPGIVVNKISSFYQTAPIDSKGDDYINAVVEIYTTLSPMDLLQTLQKIELDFGRERPYKNAPRTLDLDVLLYEGYQSQDAILTIPHPRMYERAFVLVPLKEIATQEVSDEMLSAVSEQSIFRLSES
ncbi:2-amino-4-hydroxy-6-hydroxymethyldihydropteridine diphosphokinase [Basilea psittacipulmonis]|uniref:2-amino-4-hydroxy-6-hydroxymethyldihydropteridine pyrophosphokinase n=1 Tax=Basilea psittacipulmonis DSM 24701 TaxID=1072685 RepID=A0A077DFN8_9BURK|nr:2-amino-4-hydroxy-6-hydroxymethyldihydropteridine diphosphokinase [Basilea psittacipulmonis]AIL32996.1 2-amino-4-hydroxy-6-hydroxymethyldihydropteridine pyrophosphokinase [Basilea psittacipulmonis DSM 24701]